MTGATCCGSVCAGLSLYDVLDIRCHTSFPQRWTLGWDVGYCRWARFPAPWRAGVLFHPFQFSGSELKCNLDHKISCLKYLRASAIGMCSSQKLLFTMWLAAVYWALGGSGLLIRSRREETGAAGLNPPGWDVQTRVSPLLTSLPRALFRKLLFC